MPLRLALLWPGPQAAFPYYVATAVADLDALCEHWGLPQWIVLGHSWGATLALAYDLTYAARTRAALYLSGTGLDPSWRMEYRANRAACSCITHPCCGTVSSHLTYNQ